MSTPADLVAVDASVSGGRWTPADVVVVGGGPAGASAAITCARDGRRVVLVDKARFPRDKFCGDGLTTGALRLLEGLGLRPETVESWTPATDVMVSSPSGRTVRLPLPRGQGVFAAIARRADLDAALLQVAVDAGVRVLDGHAVVGVEQRADRVVVTADGVDELHARYLIAADGMWSPIRKLLGLGLDLSSSANTSGRQGGTYLGEWHAFRQYFTSVGPAARDLWVWFEPDILPGYVWSFPLPDGGANVGFGIQRGGAVTTQDMKALWPELLRRPRIADVLGPDARAESAHRAWPIPARIDDVPLTAGRTLFVGDAAAACDPMTGEGIGQALVTGIAAAKAIEHGEPDGTAVVRSVYEESVRRELLADHRMSMLLIRALRHRRGARAGVAIAGATPWTRRNFARWLFEDEPRAIAVTPGRWHRHFLARPGAYRETPPVL